VSSSNKRPSKFVPPATHAASFKEGWQQVQRYGERNDIVAPPKVVFGVMKAADDWVRNGLRPEAQNVNGGFVYGMALIMGAFCLYAAHRKENPVLMTPDHRIAPLPEIVPPYAGYPDNVVKRISGSSILSNTAAWVRFEGGFAAWPWPSAGGPPAEDLVHVGLHILGGLTLMPPDSALAVRSETDGNRVTSLRNPMQMACLPPFPSDLPGRFQPPQ
jgi:hypothetical protein